MKDINQLAKKITDRYGIETFDKTEESKYPPHWIISKKDKRLLDSFVEFYQSNIIDITIATNFKYHNYWMSNSVTLCFSYNDNIVNLLLPKMFTELEQLNFNDYRASFISVDNNELTLQLTPNSMFQ